MRRFQVAPPKDDILAARIELRADGQPSDNRGVVPALLEELSATGWRVIDERISFGARRWVLRRVLPGATLGMTMKVVESPDVADVPLWRGSSASHG